MNFTSDNQESTPMHVLQTGIGGRQVLPDYVATKYLLVQLHYELSVYEGFYPYVIGLIISLATMYPNYSCAIYE